MDPQEEESESEDQIIADSVFNPRFVANVNHHFAMYGRNVPHLVMDSQSAVNGVTRGNRKDPLIPTFSQVGHFCFEWQWWSRGQTHNKNVDNGRNASRTEEGQEIWHEERLIGACEKE